MSEISGHGEINLLTVAQNKQLLDSVFVISRIIKVEVRVISLSRTAVTHDMITRDLDMITRDLDMIIV